MATRSVVHRQCRCTDPVGDTTLAELSPEALAAGVRAATALGRRSTCHAQGTIGLGSAVRAGMASIEHGFTMTDEIMADMIKRSIISCRRFPALPPSSRTRRLRVR